ncbi:thiamine pyrophosphate enzyme, N-terminal TPP binding domain-containing protein [Jimgerdemannia flammicorona]|uniref:Thiamine pyrophosphate enzyme, N-terminal TPP binding domain-containing protein n=1 Tax=Jimgerdemannia flammicorona TaxID=994334 RepID=A0A433D5J7_9FUNG|nr:thiamine pyrophosphate enzyme, N-terminal TPP binding domain-containing protein [Jimgerdemannia flammicorona]
MPSHHVANLDIAPAPSLLTILIMSNTTTGATIIATALKAQRVDVIFGIVGIPVVEVAEACTAQGIKFIGFRNEQSASYAASAYGFLTGRPGVCLTVGGPGVVHGLAGLANAKPVVMLAGSSDTHEVDCVRLIVCISSDLKIPGARPWSTNA